MIVRETSLALWAALFSMDPFIAKEKWLHYLPLGVSANPCPLVISWKWCHFRHCGGFIRFFFLSGFCFFSFEFPFSVPQRAFILQQTEGALEILDITGIYLWNNCAGAAASDPDAFFFFFFYCWLLKRNKISKLNFSTRSGWVARDIVLLKQQFWPEWNSAHDSCGRMVLVRTFQMRCMSQRFSPHCLI